LAAAVSVWKHCPELRTKNVFGDRRLFLWQTDCLLTANVAVFYIRYAKTQTNVICTFFVF
jgi:hypothetical protein